MKNLFVILFLSFSTVLMARDEEVVLHTPTGDIYGTLTLPDSTSPVPVVLIISGSGPTDRDGNQPSMKNNSLKMLSNALFQHGIAMLRFDKRAIAASRAAIEKEEDLRFENYVDDVRLWIDMLGKDSRFSGVIVAGHSEGSLIGMLASQGNAKVKSFISIAGPAIPADEMLIEQMKNQPQQIQDIVTPILASLKQGEQVADVPEILYSIFRPSVQPYLISLIKYNPQTEIRKLTVPVLVIQGTTDIQVNAGHADLLSSASLDARKVIIENMSHVLKDCTSTNQLEQVMGVYTNPDLPINTELVKSIVEFIR
jgi:pimeloyl-ACP methyl ester carboxylesterase